MRLTLQQPDHPLTHAHVHVRLRGLEVVVQVVAETGEQGHRLILPTAIDVLLKDYWCVGTISGNDIRTKRRGGGEGGGLHENGKDRGQAQANQGLPHLSKRKKGKSCEMCTRTATSALDRQRETSKTFHERGNRFWANITKCSRYIG